MNEFAFEVDFISTRHKIGPSQQMSMQTQLIPVAFFSQPATSFGGPLLDM
jgi:hypothetical protein